MSTEGAMMKTRRLVATLSGLAILFSGAASASVAKSERSPTPEKVKADFGANPKRPTVVEFRRVTPQEATTKAFPSGRTGEVETAAQRDVDSPATASDEGAAGGNACWYVALRNSLGVFPYEREHHAATYWCAVYGHYLTYRRTDTRGDTNGFCSTTGTGSWKMGGGVYYRWVKVHSWSSFSCPTPWWWSLHDTLWMNIAYNVWGNFAVEESYP
jgi:hypothetical protein